MDKAMSEGLSAHLGAGATIMEELVKEIESKEDEIATLERQVALMAEALRLVEWQPQHDSYGNRYSDKCPRCHEHIERGHATDCEIGQALQSASKVLWSGPAVVLQDGTITLEGGSAKYLKRRQVLTATILGDDVIVLEGPNALQEQSKAELPAGECSVAGKQGQNSEQGGDE